MVLKGVSVMPSSSVLSVAHEDKGRLNFGLDVLSLCIQHSQCQQTSWVGGLRMKGA